MKELIPLGQIATLIMGQSPDSSTYNTVGEGLPFFQGKTEFGSVYPKTAKWCSKPLKIAEADDILISVRAPVGPTNLVQETCCIGRGLAAIRPTPSVVDRDYLWLYLQYFEPSLVKKGQGSTFEAISGSDLVSIYVPVPSFDQQHRIADSLKAQLSVVEEARNAVNTQLNELTHYADAVIRQSILHSDSKEACLGDVLDEVKQGIGPTWNQYPVLGATRAGLALAKDPVGKKPERYKPVTAGTVFYNPMRIMIGSIAMVDEDDTPGITSPDYVVLKGRQGKVDSRWFYYWLRSSYGEHCIASLTRGAVRERMLFNRLAEGKIELPPFHVQHTSSQQLTQIKPIKEAIKAQLKDIEILPSRLLAQAFGEA